MNFLLKLLGFDQSGDVHRVVEGDWHASQPVSAYVLWTIVAVGLLLALVNFLPRLAMRGSVRVWTFFLRAGMVLLLLAIVCGLEWHVLLEINEKQRWTIVVDDSASMATADIGDQSRFVAVQADVEKIQDALKDKVDLTVTTFSGQPREDGKPSEGPTLFQEVVARTALSRSHVDRLIVLTDGRDSERRDLQRLGEDLRARDIKLAVALYGSDSPAQDMGISAEPERNVLRLGEELIVRGALGGQQSAADETIIVKENEKTIRTLPAPPGTDRRFEMRHKPLKKGQYVYTVERHKPGKKNQDGEEPATPLANRVSFIVNVVEEKINVLLLEGYPRFEFKFFKLVLEVDPLVNLVSVAHIPGGGVHVQGQPLHRNPELGLISSPAELFKYDVVILRDVPRQYFRAGGDATETRMQALVQFVTKRGGGLMVLGGQDVYRAGGYADSHLASILPFDLTTRVGNTDQFEGLFYVTIPKTAYDHPILQLLPNSGENRERLNSLRQLDGSNNVGGFKPLATPLLTRMVKVKDKGDKLIEKETPIMGYMAVGEGKVLGSAVDTLWRWQLQPDFDDPPLTMLLANSMRYLAPPPGRKPGMPNVTMSNPTPQVGQELELTTDLRDNNYDPIQSADLVVTVTRPDESSYHMYPRDLPEEPGHYAYRVALDQPGKYTVKAEFGKFESTREFVAGAAAGEFADLSVDREGMARLVKAANGELVGKVDDWLSKVDTSPARKPAVRDLEVWNSPLLLLLFVLLVSADCYIRKRQGLA
jgi:hypothetical protein